MGSVEKSTLFFYSLFYKMKNIFSLSATLFLSFFLFGQESILVEISTNRLRDDVFFFASDSLAGRQFPNKGHELAAGYIASVFHELGLEAINNTNQPYFQNIPVRFTAKGSTHLLVGKKWLNSGDRFSFASNQSFNDSLSLPIRYIGSKKRLSPNWQTGDTIIHIVGKSIIKALSSARKISHETGAQSFAISLPTNPNQAYSLINNERIIGRYRYPSGILGMGARNPQWLYSLLPETKDPFNVFLFHDDIVPYIYGLELNDLDDFISSRKQKRNGSKNNISTLTFHSNFFVDEKEIYDYNVIGYLKGTDLSDEVIIICGHYDHLGKTGKGIYYGADDNASGTAGVLELARMCKFAKEKGFEFRRTLVFIAFGAEETGLNGSYFYVSNPIFPLEKTIWVLNLDMIGRWESEGSNPGGAIVRMYKGHRRAKRKALKVIDSQMDGFTFQKSLTLTQNFMYRFGSDHFPFLRQGVPVAIVTTGQHQDYHKTTDTPEKINYENMSSILKGLFVLISEVANDSKTITIKN